ncbi:MAG: glycosyltransferase [Patescibacteria group bacterium]|mgnify:FL=1
MEKNISKQVNSNTGLAQLDAVRDASEACDQAVLLYCAGANERSNEEMRQIRKSCNILIFSIAYIPFVGGAELAVKEITDRISADLSFDMITLRFNKNWPKFEKIGNINIYRISSPKIFFPFAAFLKATRLHTKRRYRFIWSIMANRAGYAALFFKLTHPKVKYLLTLQEGDTTDYPKKRAGFLWIFVGFLFRKIFTKADCVQAISKFLADWARNMGKKDCVEIVPNGIDLNNLKSKISNLKNREGKIIITTSRLVHKNGIDILIEAIAELKKEGLSGDIQCQILGSGPDEEKLKDLTRILKLSDEVVFLGHIDPEVVYTYLANADIFVRPSRSEGLGSSFLEAMGAGLPIIGTSVGGIPDFLKDPSEVGEDKATGLFAKVEDPKDLADKIKTLINDENFARKIAWNGKNLAITEYSWDSVAGKMRLIFNNLCG